MKELIAFCGLDCEVCEARKATIENDDTLREKVAKLWTELNGVTITSDMINFDCGIRYETAIQNIFRLLY